VLGVAHEFEARVDRLAQHVGQVVQVQRGQVARAVLHAQRAEGPGHRVTAVRVHVHGQRLEARAFGQEAAAADAVRQRGVTPLQEGHHRADGLAVALEHVEEGWPRLRAAPAGVDGRSPMVSRTAARPHRVTAGPAPAPAPGLPAAHRTARERRKPVR
jgi:hypothetical protein